MKALIAPKKQGVADGNRKLSGCSERFINRRYCSAADTAESSYPAARAEINLGAQDKD